MAIVKTRYIYIGCSPLKSAADVVMIGGGGGVELLPVELTVTGESCTNNIDKINPLSL